MPSESLAIHASAVAIDGLALLIRGPSRSGKSMLALELIAASEAAYPTLLIGDDRIVLTRAKDDVMAMSHPRISGLIEKRGVGILSMPFQATAPVAGIVDLEEARSCDLMGANFPALILVRDSMRTHRFGAVRAWFAAASTAHRRRKDGRN